MEKKVKIGERILEILATAGVVGIVALCEGARDSGWIKGRNSPESRVKRSLNRLSQKDLVVRIKTDSGTKWQLTPAGKKLYDQNNLDQITISKPVVWDGKWRIVIFDLPEKEGKRTRDVFRNKLKDLGFILLQRSVFVCPWPCEQEIIDLAQILGIENFVQIIEGNLLLNSAILKIRFGL
ncbi:MAG: CRISPR-associated endonuclease Cas2 [bacterium]|nr:CRISPR-associated endonuclease Cas2 [bacterium]